ncbi:MAG: extensin family protein [Ahrensia sp.]|nr:extensin family protein [Ahrensia sp.]
MATFVKYTAKLTVFSSAMLLLASCGFGGSKPVPSANIDRSVQTKSIFSLPRLGLPTFGGSAYRGSGLSAEEQQCRIQLKRLGVAFEDVAPIRESESCGINNPVKVSSLARGVALTPAATLNCQTALASAQWLQNDAGPAARSRYLSGIAEVRQLSSYSCRRIGGDGKWSEHSIGNALDIGSFKLNNGRKIDVARPSFFAMREKSFLTSVRGQACGRFGTVLGPGDKDHHDHFHFDLRERSQTYCSMK